MFQRVSPETMLRLRPIMFLGVYGVPLLPFVGMQLAAKPNQYNLWAWWGIFIYLVVSPILELVLGKDSANPTSGQIISLEKSLYYKLLVIMIIPAQLSLLLYGAHVFSSINALNLFGRIGWILSNGMCSATLALLAGHELIHKPSSAEQMMGSFLLASVCNTGFRVEHIRGHHVNVSTPLDVYSAGLHQSLYDYIPKTCYHNLVSPWKLEKKRLKRKGHSVWSWRNEQIIGYAVSAAMAVIFFSLCGVLGLIFFFTQSVVAWIVLQIINYIQHYGLTRPNRDSGKYGHPTAAHAWNSNFWLTNISLLHLPRHPDHHVHPSRCYQVLRHLDESPQMPTGYAAMFVIALIPPLWFKLMDPLILAYHRARGHKIPKANFN
jgi:alkane 1-monooxygenase